MMNFNGQLKKRSVNLGGGFKQNRNQLLQNTQKERERRERERLQEKSTLMIQRNVKSYIEFLKFKYDLAANWSVEDGDLNSTIYHFNLFYSYIFKHNSSKLDQIKSLLQIITPDSIHAIRPFNINRTYRTIFESLRLIDMSTSDGAEILVSLLHLSKLIHEHVTSYHVQIIPVLTSILQQISGSDNLNYIVNQIFDAVDLYSSSEVPSYLKFLANFKNPSVNITINYDAISTNSQINDSDLTLCEKLSILGLIIRLSSQGELKLPVLKAITLILSTLHNVTLVTSHEKAQSSSLAIQDDQEDAENLYEKYDQQLIDDKLNQELKKLYTRDFISKAADIFHDDIHFSSLLYSSLISIKPEWKSNVLIFLIPNSFEKYLNYIINNSVFKSYSEIAEERILSFSRSELSEFFEQNTDIKIFLTRELYTFLEIFQFQLIISNDFELFLNHGFSREKFRDIALFLKKFVLNLIWNEGKIDKVIVDYRVEYQKLFQLVNKVLKQVYLKNSRLLILKTEDWLIDSLRFDLNSLVATIQQYEARKDDFEDNDDQEVTEEQKFLDNLTSDSKSRLNIFLKTPFFISFTKRVEIFQKLIDQDKEEILSSSSGRFSIFSDFLGQKQTATIRREHLLEDAYENFSKIGDTFKHQLAIIFVNDNGREQGIDGGGITKEFLISVVNEGFHDLELFSETSTHEIYPNPQISLKYQYRVESEAQLKKLEYIKFLGKVIGKCLYERVLIDINFAQFFLTKLNNNFQNSFDDLKSYDQDLYSNLVKLLQMTAEELDSLNLTFTTDERLDGGRVISIDLITNGSLTQVTTSNRLKFIHEISNYKLNKAINLQTNAFLAGLYTIINKSWLHMFNPFELQELIAGEDDVDIKDLYNNTVYGGYEPTDITIKYFWEILNEIDSSDKLKFIKFVTSVPRAPLLGFKALVPNLGIRKVESIDSLPTASTCVNLFNLPDYKDKTVLKQKLLYAINAEAGFDLA